MALTKRGVNIVLCFGCRVLTQLGRFAWNFLILQMADEFSWTGAEQGRIKAAYAGGYVLTQILGGIAGSKFGNKMFQCCSVLASAIGLLIVPLLLHRLESIPGAPSTAKAAQLVLFVTGVCCGPQMPTSTGFCQNWCLPSEKAWASSISSLAGVLSSLLNTIVIAAVADVLGWRYTMFTLSTVSFAYLGVLVMLTSETPLAMGSELPESEAELFRNANMLGTALSAPSKKSRDTALASTSLQLLFTNPATW